MVLKWIFSYSIVTYCPDMIAPLYNFMLLENKNINFDAYNYFNLMQDREALSGLRDGMASDFFSLCFCNIVGAHR